MDDSINKIENAIAFDNNIFGVVRSFVNVNNFYELPTNSSQVGVYKCENLSDDLKIINMNLIKKVYCMPCWQESYSTTRNSEINPNKYIVSTLLHYND